MSTNIQLYFSEVPWEEFLCLNMCKGLPFFDQLVCSWILNTLSRVLWFIFSCSCWQLESFEINCGSPLADAQTLYTDYFPASNFPLLYPSFLIFFTMLWFTIVHIWCNLYLYFNCKLTAKKIKNDYL